MRLLYDGENEHVDCWDFESVRGRKITLGSIVLLIRLLNTACGTPTSVDHAVNVYLCPKSVVKNRIHLHILNAIF
jgi:hypothetical protein